MKNSIKDFYKSTFPQDTLGNDISEQAMFSNLENNIANVYEYIGVGDSMVRERVFAELAKRKGVEYRVIYNQWLNQ